MSAPKPGEYGEPWKRGPYGGVYCDAGTTHRLIADARNAIGSEYTQREQRIIACVNALSGHDPEALAEVIEAARDAASEFDRMLSAQSDCGDPGAECALHDAHKDWSTSGILRRLRAALAAFGEGKR